VGGEIISFLRFADDIALLANNEHDLGSALEEMARCFHKYQLIINWQKISYDVPKIKPNP